MKDVSSQNVWAIDILPKDKSRNALVFKGSNFQRNKQSHPGMGDLG